MLFFSRKQKSGAEWLVVGLGNPGKEYDGTRHNCGYMALDYIADKLGVQVTRSRFDSLCREVKLDGRSALFLKPTTYMNLSGNAVSKAASYYGIPPEKVIVIHDDVDIPCGAIRIKSGGSSGGHNGIKSIISCLGTENFCRIKIGIGGEDRSGMIEHVLSRPSAAQRKLIAERFEDVCQAVMLIVDGSLSDAQGRFNHKGQKTDASD